MLSKSYLNRQIIVFSAAFGTALYIDFIATNAVYSKFAVFLFALLSIVLIGLEKKALLLKLIFAWFLLIPEFPRDILDIYDSLSSHESVYRPISSYGLGPLRLELVILALLLVDNRVKISQKELWLLVFLVVLVFLSFLQGWSNNVGTSGFNNPLYLFRGIVFYCVATLAYRELEKKELFDLLRLAFTISGLRTLFFLLFDVLIKGGEFSLDLGVQPYFFLIFLLSIKEIDLKTLSFWSYLNLLFPSRSFILIAILVFAIIWISRWNGVSIFRRVSRFVIIFLIGGMVLKSYNERLYGFFLWKFEVLETISGKSQMSGSGNVRKLELLNIWKSNRQNVGTLLLGNGPYAKYDFSHFPLKVEGVIDSKSYSLDQRTEGKYYTTHNFISAWLLKFGLLGLSWYVIFLSRKYTSKISRNILISFILIYIFYSTPVAAALLIYLNKNGKSKLNYSVL
jgi:hypothetical protein